MQHYLAQLGSWVTVVQGVIFVVCVLVFRRGIVGTIAFYAAPPRDMSAGGKSSEGADRASNDADVSSIPPIIPYGGAAPPPRRAGCREEMLQETLGCVPSGQSWRFCCFAGSAAAAAPAPAPPTVILDP